MRPFLLVFLFFIVSQLQAQSYPPAAGQPGSTAIDANSSLFVAWATGITVERGLIDISDPSAMDMGSTNASFGEPEDALGPATNSPVSLGDAGEAILTFDTPIGDGLGFDFAVFENSFSDTFLELAFVEVSSDGTNFFRFPSHSETQTNTQVGGFGDLDPTFLNNFAGKYRALFGTPFDISELEDDPLLNKNSITHVKIIDVVGSIDPNFARFDSFGNTINDPFNTPFWTGGFDLDAVGVINQEILSTSEIDQIDTAVYPNPVSNELNIKSNEPLRYTLFDIHGRRLFSGSTNRRISIDISHLNNGVYILKITQENATNEFKILKQ